MGQRSDLHQPGSNSTLKGYSRAEMIEADQTPRTVKYALIIKYVKLEKMDLEPCSHGA